MIEQELRCAGVLTESGWLGPAVIRIDGSGFIQAVERLAANSQTDHGHVIAGMPNLHSHAFQRQMAGLSGAAGPTGDSFWSWRELMYRLAGCISPDQMRSIAAFLQAEMLENGYTSCAEFHYVHHQPGGQPYTAVATMAEQIVQAAELSGIALTLLPVFYSRSGFSSRDVNPGQLRFRTTVDQYLELWQACNGLVRNHPLHLCGIAPHSLRAVAPEQLDVVLAAIARDYAHQSIPVHIHIAEQPLEVDECRAALGARPVEWLLDRYAVDSRWCLVHATHSTETEIESALNCGLTIGLCPSTEADLGDGYFPIESWFSRSGSFGVGSDSNLRLSPAEELRMLEFQARLHTGERNVLVEHGHSCGRSLYQRAAYGGAQALGQLVGRISVGYRADLLELDQHHCLLAGRSGDTLLDSWILAGDQSMIRTVWVAGNVKVQEGKHLAREALERAFRQTMLELM